MLKWLLGRGPIQMLVAYVGGGVTIAGILNSGPLVEGVRPAAVVATFLSPLPFILFLHRPGRPWLSGIAILALVAWGWEVSTEDPDGFGASVILVVPVVALLIVAVSYVFYVVTDPVNRGDNRGDAPSSRSPA